MEVEPADWDDVLQGLGVTDVYYARGFVEASALLGKGAPVLLRTTDADGDVLFPCLLRSDPPDVVTPYGYGGPLGIGPWPPHAAFARQYEDWCAGRGLLSSFVVFHPLFGNAEPAIGLRRTDLAGTVAWPLDGDGELLAGMHKHHRRLVRRAQAAGCEVTVEPAPADLGGFVAIYEETMRRTAASPFYRFPPAYWRALQARVPLVAVEVRRRGALLAGVLGMGEPPWLHYHLGAAAKAARGTGASHLALLELARWGRANGFRTLHLGGGVGGRDDSLLEFKLRFAPDGRVGASIGKAVHDLPGYLARSGTTAVDWDGFFPAYREPR